jgi:hypothetical protein
MNLEQQGNREIVTVLTRANDWYSGSFTPNDSNVRLERVFQAAAPTFNAKAEMLIDVQDRGDRIWTFLLADRIKSYDPVQRKWLADVRLPVSDPTIAYGQVGGRGVLIGESGLVWWVADNIGPSPTRFGRYEIKPGETTALDENGTVWRLSNNQVIQCPAPLDGDRTCKPYDSSPVTALTVSPLGELLAAGQNGSISLAHRATLKPEIPQALDAGWLRWDRARSSFVVASDSGILTFSKSEFITDNRLLFESVDAVLASADRWFFANRSGIWNVPRSLDLTDRSITFKKIAMNSPIQVAHSRFIASNGEWNVGESSLRSQANTFDFRVGSVLFSENLAGRTIAVTIPFQNESISALGDNGFLWDANRRGLAYDADQLVLQSDAGIAPNEF